MNGELRFKSKFTFFLRQSLISNGDSFVLVALPREDPIRLTMSDRRCVFALGCAGEPDGRGGANDAGDDSDYSFPSETSRPQRSDTDDYANRIESVSPNARATDTTTQSQQSTNSERGPSSSLEPQPDRDDYTRGAILAEMVVVTFFRAKTKCAMVIRHRLNVQCPICLETVCGSSFFCLVGCGHGCCEQCFLADDGENFATCPVCRALISARFVLTGAKNVSRTDEQTYYNASDLERLDAYLHLESGLLFFVLRDEFSFRRDTLSFRRLHVTFISVVASARTDDDDDVAVVDAGYAL